MTAQISFNPVLTTNALGSFNVDSVGYIQGVMLDDPAVRYQLAGGILASSETLPMWGGVGISELVPGGGSPPIPSDTLGTVVSRATTLAAHTTGQLTGFSVFNQDNSMVTTPQSPVPLAGSGMSVHFLRLGSNARIVVKCDPALVSLKGSLITTQVSWDFTNQLLVAYDTVAALPVKILDVNVGNSMTVTYSSGTGFATWNRSGTTALIQI
jgi:hypothetical protein